MRKRGRTDDNQQEIIDDLRKVGVSVRDTSALGQGFPDIVCGYRNKNFMFEIKNPEQPPSKRKLTDDELQFFNTWNGQVHKIETTKDAINIMIGECC